MSTKSPRPGLVINLLLAIGMLLAIPQDVNRISKELPTLVGIHAKYSRHQSQAVSLQASLEKLEGEDPELALTRLFGPGGKWGLLDLGGFSGGHNGRGEGRTCSFASKPASMARPLRRFVMAMSMPSFLPAWTLSLRTRRMGCESSTVSSSE